MKGFLYAQRTSAEDGSMSVVTVENALDRLYPYYKDKALTRDTFMSGVPMRTPWATYQTWEGSPRA